jgi:hypothetical protein
MVVVVVVVAVAAAAVSVIKGHDDGFPESSHTMFLEDSSAGFENHFSTAQQYKLLCLRRKKHSLL